MEAAKTMLEAVYLDDTKKLDDLFSTLDINAPMLFASPPSFIAARQGALNVLAYFFNRDDCDKSARGMLEQNLLMQAVQTEQIEAVNLIADSYPEQLSEKDQANRSVINYAAETGNVSLAKMLVYNYKVSLKNSGENPIYSAAMSEKYDMVKFLTSQNRFSDILFLLIKYDLLDLPTIQALDQGGVDVHVTDHFGKDIKEYFSYITNPAIKEKLEQVIRQSGRIYVLWLYKHYWHSKLSQNLFRALYAFI